MRHTLLCFLVLSAFSCFGEESKLDKSDKSAALTDQTLSTGTRQEDTARVDSKKSMFHTEDDDLPKRVDKEYSWRPLFDGKTLDGWSVPVFGGDGEVSVANGCVQIGMGAMMTGIKYEKDFPRIGYEIRFEAQRILGNDFFGAVTFPYKDSCCTFINGGWGGGVTGLSCVDGLDASENETTEYFNYRDQQWYQFRIRVTKDAIKVWIKQQRKDDGLMETKQVINLDTKDKTISLRDETSQYQPLGFCTWVSEGCLRNIVYRKISPEEK